MVETNLDEVIEQGTGMSLDALLGMDDSEMGKDLDGVDLSGYGDIEEDEKIDFPHFKVNTRKFIDILKLSNIVSQGAGRDVVTKAIGMEVKGGELQVYLTDFDIFVEKSTDILNTENILNDFIVMNLAVISKLVKATGSVVTIFKNDDKYFIKLIGGDMELEVMKIDKDQMRLKNKSKFTSDGVLPTSDFYKVIKDLFVLANAGVTPAQRRIFFSGDKIHSVFLYCIARHVSDKTLPSMDIKIKDIRILYSLALGCEDVELLVSRCGNRIMIEGSNFIYSFLLSDNKPPQPMMDSMDKIFAGQVVYIDYVQLVKITEVSADLQYSSNRLDFNYTDEGQINCILKTKRGDSTFILRGTPNTNVKKLEKPVSIQSSLLKTLVKVFTQESTVGVVIDKMGIGIKSDKYDAVLFTESE